MLIWLFLYEYMFRDFFSLYLQLEIKSWLVTGDSLSLELLNTERGNRSIALSRIQELQNTSAAQYKTVRVQSSLLLYCPLPEPLFKSFQNNFLCNKHHFTELKLSLLEYSVTLYNKVHLLNIS